LSCRGLAAESAGTALRALSAGVAAPVADDLAGDDASRQRGGNRHIWKDAAARSMGGRRGHIGGRAHPDGGRGLIGRREEIDLVAIKVTRRRRRGSPPRRRRRHEGHARRRQAVVVEVIRGGRVEVESLVARRRRLLIEDGVKA
jgi:hypothetical protein